MRLTRATRSGGGGSGSNLGAPGGANAVGLRLHRFSSKIRRNHHQQQNGGDGRASVDAGGGSPCNGAAGGGGGAGGGTSSATSGGGCANRTLDNQLKTRRKVAKMLIAVVTMFAVNFFPVHLIPIINVRKISNVCMCSYVNCLVAEQMLCLNAYCRQRFR